MSEQAQGSQLLNRRLVGALLTAVIVLTAGFGAWWLATHAGPGGGSAALDGGERSPEVRSEPTLPDPHARPSEPRVVRGTVLVNDVPVATVGVRSPVFVCLIVEPLAEGQVTVEPAAARLSVLDAAGRPVATAWTMSQGSTTSLEPGRPLAMSWATASTLPPGTYHITVAEPTWLDLRGADATGTNIASASLTVTDVPDVPRVVAHYERRILALQGRLTEWLTRLEADLRADPSDHAVAGELVDALERSGRTAEALAALGRLASDMQARQQRLRPTAPTELPDWVVFKLAELESRSHTGH